MIWVCVLGAENECLVSCMSNSETFRYISWDKSEWLAKDIFALECVFREEAWI